ncbi:DUF4352 domain-containing protein [Actinomadura fibrosa]|uniref:DUF4352 domain-containing protein n=1 Tax=Actinomadura fibrosa TaxID=111802 RepID=A0ABW2XQN4_9ACTN|nr:DUF4352 domain-containing protein [Actinomadura fibrosa]
MATVKTGTDGAESGPEIAEAAPEPTGPERPRPEPTGAGPEGTAGSSVAGVGGTIDLSGMRDVRMAVTLSKVVSDAESGSEFERPAAGKRFYAVRFTMRNIGAVAYDDSPSNGAQIVDGADESYEATVVAGLAAGSTMDSATIAPGDTRKGYVVFEIPAEARIVRVRFALDSGLADDTGQWRVPQA